jgi:DNA-binding NtrC family response regulator
VHFGRTATIEIPPLADRRHELEQLVAEYASDAVSALGAPGPGFREHDLERLCALDLKTMDELDELTLRVVAERNWGVTAGAHRLGITHPGLSKWLRDRGIPT